MSRRKTTISISLRKDLIDIIKQLAEKQDISVSAVIEYLLMFAIVKINKGDKIDDK